MSKQVKHSDTCKPFRCECELGNYWNKPHETEEIYMCEMCNVNEAEDDAAWCAPCNKENNLSRVVEDIASSLRMNDLTIEEVYDRIKGENK